MKPLKIAYCIPSLYIHGGMERVVTNKANYLAEEVGHEVYIIMTDAKDKTPFFPLSPKVHLIQLDEDFEQLWDKPLHQKIVTYLRLMRNYKKKLTQCLHNIKPDITISTLRREINFITGIKDGSKKVGELHVNREEFRNLNQDKAAGWLKKWVQAIWQKELIDALKKLDHFVVLTERDKALWGELNPQKVSAIANPLSFYSKTPSNCEAKTAVAVGRFCYQKGFDLLLTAWKEVVARHPDWVLHVYGDNGEKITNYVAKLGIQNNCQLYPVTPHVEQELVKHSIFVLSSRFEGFGMVTCEAMACGVPPVAFNCHYGPAEIIRHNQDGLLVEAGNPTKLAEGINQLIENDALRQSLGRNAYQNITRYHISTIGKEWNELFQKLVAYQSTKEA
ncbi:MAG: glycosyltransferase family 4 protein [Phocaeicola sp.]